MNLKNGFELLMLGAGKRLLFAILLSCALWAGFFWAVGSLGWL